MKKSTKQELRPYQASIVAEHEKNTATDSPLIRKTTRAHLTIAYPRAGGIVAALKHDVNHQQCFHERAWEQCNQIRHRRRPASYTPALVAVMEHVQFLTIRLRLVRVYIICRSGISMIA